MRKINGYGEILLIALVYSRRMHFLAVLMALMVTVRSYKIKTTGEGHRNMNWEMKVQPVIGMNQLVVLMIINKVGWSS